MAFVEVILEADPMCPRCRSLYKYIRALCNELDIPFTVKLFGTRSIAAVEEDTSSHTFDPEWVKRYGLLEHKLKLSKLRPILEYFKRNKVQSFPQLIIRWHDGSRVKEIVIMGFDESDKERLRMFLANLRILLTTLKRL